MAEGLMPADVVVTDARIYTARPQRGMAEALAVKDGKIVFVGNALNGARFLGREKEAGSIEVGKSGDFIVLNQDILRLADEGHAEDIRNTDVLETWFMGKRIYVSKVRKTIAKRGLTK
jgi:hypothetical protein